MPSSISDFLQMDASGIPFWILLFIIVLVLWNLAVTLIIMRQVRINKSLVGSEHPKSLKEVILDQMSKAGGMQAELSNLESHIMSMQESYMNSIQKIGLVRFSPFEDTGSDQSFALALLDAADNGIIISSLHGRDRTRMYAKKIVHGDGDGYALSEEEKESIVKATLVSNTA
ncbi:DUF4446 family protein [candidate division WWE3 bacterium]|uniref:DUF4446 family protein n=1 Tax=candidate division WWE3 bacterium TaxID=2053526 RepID=A0A955RXC2_UNCKA|nr:DUF4446 family protein [candidate division WWE3 bacterium]